MESFRTDGVGWTRVAARPTIAGMIIRPATPADGEAIAKVHVESWRTTCPGIVPQAHLDDLSWEARAPAW